MAPSTSPACSRRLTSLRNAASGPRPWAFRRLQVRSMMNAVWRMMSMMSAATRYPPCWMFLPNSPMTGRKYQMAIETAAAATNPMGTMKRLIFRGSSATGQRQPTAASDASFVLPSFHRERSESFLLRLVMVEHHDQLRHGEEILQPLAETAQLDLAASTAVIRKSPHQHADRDRIERLAILHVQDEAFIPGRRLVHDRLLQLVGLVVAEEVPLRVQHHDRANRFPADGHFTPLPALRPVWPPRSSRWPALRSDTRRTPATAW